MSERPFFTLRYAAPGYTFILVTVLVAYPELQEMISQAALMPEQVTLVVALLGFLALLGGGALGFLISQVWYYFYRRYLRLNYGRLPNTIETLIRRYRLCDDPQRQSIFLDYVHHLSSKKLQKYIQRRYDLMQLCGSTLVSAFISSIFGVSIQIYLLHTATQDNVILATGFALLAATFLVFCWETRARALGAPPFPWYLAGLSTLLPAYLLFTLHTRVHDRLVFLIVVTVIILLFSSLLDAQIEHSMATEVSVTEVVNVLKKFPEWKAREVFPPDYFRE